MRAPPTDEYIIYIYNYSKFITIWYGPTSAMEVLLPIIETYNYVLLQ